MQCQAASRAPYERHVCRVSTCTLECQLSKQLEAFSDLIHADGACIRNAERLAVELHSVCVASRLTVLWRRGLLCKAASPAPELSVRFGANCVIPG
jgi:hypothetical protein